MERTNDDRAERARRAVLAYQGEDECDRINAGPEAAEEVLADLEGDLRHLCDRLGVSIADAERRGYRCYLEEVADEKDDAHAGGRLPQTVLARELEPGWEVKAPGAAGWSRIRACGHVTPDRVEAFTEWGSIMYVPSDRVEALPPLGGMVEAGGMSTSDGLGA